MYLYQHDQGSHSCLVLYITQTDWQLLHCSQCLKGWLVSACIFVANVCTAVAMLYPGCFWARVCCLKPSQPPRQLALSGMGSLLQQASYCTSTQDQTLAYNACDFIKVLRTVERLAVMVSPAKVSGRSHHQSGLWVSVRGLCLLTQRAACMAH